MELGRKAFASEKGESDGCFTCFPQCHVIDPLTPFSQPIRTKDTKDTYCVFSLSQSESKLLFGFLAPWHIVVAHHFFVRHE